MEAGKSKSLAFVCAVNCVDVIVGSEFRFGRRRKGEGIARSEEKPFSSRKRRSHAMLCREIARTEVRREVAEIIGGHKM